VRKYNVGHKRDGKKDEIVQAAVQLFMEKGFDRVSLSEIAGKINLGRTTIYEYFNNKNEILATYLEREMTVYHNKVTAIFKKKAAIEEKLRDFITLQLEYGSYHRGFSQLFGSLSRDAKDISAKTEAAIREKHREIYSLLIHEFNDALQGGKVRNLSPGLIMQLLINATSFPVKSGNDLRQTAEQVFSIFWSGISKI
jgi:AcrR family transcriptional regulator